MNLNTLFVVNLNGMFDSSLNLFVVDLDLFDNFSGLDNFDLDSLNQFLGFVESFDDDLSSVDIFNVLKSVSISDDSSVDNISSVDDVFPSDNKSLSSDDLSCSVDSDSVVMELSLPVSDSQMPFVSIVMMNGNVEFESVDIDSWFDDISSNGVEVVDSVSVNSDFPVIESSVGSLDDGGSNSDSVSQFQDSSSVSQDNSFVGLLVGKFSDVDSESDQSDVSNLLGFS